MPNPLARLSAAWRALTAPQAKAGPAHPVPLPGYGGAALGYGRGYGYGLLPTWGPHGLDVEGECEDDGAADPMANPVVMAAVAWLARNFPVPDLQVVRYGGSRDGEPVEGHDLVKLLDRPNQVDDFFSFHERFCRTDLINYDSFLLKRKTKSGNRVVDLWWLDPAAVEVVPDPARKVAVLGYRYRDGRGLVEYGTDEVIHVRNGSDPADPLRGRGPLAAVAPSLAVVTRGARYTGTVLRNGGATNLILSAGNPEFPINSADAVYLREWLLDQIAGRNLGKPLVAEGHLKVDRGGVSPRDMDLKELPDRAYADVAAALGFALMVLGFKDSQRTYSNYAESLKATYHNALIPLQARYAEALGRGMPELVGPRERVVWDYSDVEALNESRGEVFDRLVKATAGAAILAVDEARETLNLGPMPKPPEPAAPADPIAEAEPEAVAVEPDEEPEPEASKALAAAGAKAEPEQDYVRDDGGRFSRVPGMGGPLPGRLDATWKPGSPVENMAAAAKGLRASGFGVEFNGYEVIRERRWFTGGVSLAVEPDGQILLNRKGDIWADPGAAAARDAASGLISAGHPAHELHRAMGLALYARKVGPAAYARQSEAGFRGDAAETARSVSIQATASRAEFVAEVYAGRLAGREFPPEVEALYDWQGGPRGGRGDWTGPKPHAGSTPEGRAGRPAMRAGDAPGNLAAAASAAGAEGVAAEGGEVMRRGFEAELGGFAASKLFGAYDPISDRMLLNPGADYWADPAGSMREAHARGWSSTAEPYHVVDHELGHAAHRAAVGLRGMDRVRATPMTPAESDMVRRGVSEYAATAPHEFVAEVFAARRHGRSFPAPILDLYRRYGGPEP